MKMCMGLDSAVKKIEIMKFARKQMVQENTILSEVY